MAGETVGQNWLGVGQIFNYFHFAIFPEDSEHRGEHRTGGGHYQLVGVGIGVDVGVGVGIDLGIAVGVAIGVATGAVVGGGVGVDVGVDDGVGAGILASIVPRFQVLRHHTGVDRIQTKW